MMTLGKTCVLSQLDQFKGRTVEIAFHFITKENPLFATYIFKQFSYSIDDNYLQMKDDTEPECDTSIKLNNIVKVNHLDDTDIYHDVIDIKTNIFIVSVTLIEEKPKYPRCKKCGREVYIPEESLYSITGNGNYADPYDGENVNVNVCGKCLYSFLGEVN